MEQSPTELTLTCYRIHKYASMPIVPAPLNRAWMDATREHFANRCLPLLLGNQSGWFIVNQHHISVMWHGGPEIDDISIIVRSGPQGTPPPLISHFGSGIVTWNLNYLFRTSPGYNLWVKGPTNLPKDGIVPLEGIVETDWSPATFTMNWKCTTSNMAIEFRPGEPICMILPIKRGEVESFHPHMRELDDNPEIAEEYRTWSDSRTQFLKGLREPGSDAQAIKWQKDYFQGVTQSGDKASSHQVKLNVREFKSD